MVRNLLINNAYYHSSCFDSVVTDSDDQKSYRLKPGKIFGSLLKKYFTKFQTSRSRVIKRAKQRLRQSEHHYFDY